MSVWNHNGSVVEMLNLNQLVADLKNTLETKPNFLQEKIREYFLENPHHLALSMFPDVSAYVCSIIGTQHCMHLFI